MASLAERSMQLQATIQDGQLMLGNARDSISLEPVRLR